MENYQKKTLRLTEITRYSDVETGRLVLTVGEKQRSWKAIWLTNLRCNIRGGHTLPREVLPLTLKANARYLECPRLKLTQRIGMWLVPLQSKEWTDLGVDLYLCNEGEAITPLPEASYRQLQGAIKRFDIRELSVEVPRWTVSGNRLNHDEGVDFDADFWINSEETNNFQSLKEFEL